MTYRGAVSGGTAGMSYEWPSHLPAPNAAAREVTARACRLVFGRAPGTRVLSIKVSKREFDGLEKNRKDTLAFGWWAPDGPIDSIYGVPILVVEE